MYRGVRVITDAAACLAQVFNKVSNHYRLHHHLSGATRLLAYILNDFALLCGTCAYFHVITTIQYACVDTCVHNVYFKGSFILLIFYIYLRAVGRKVLWSSACVCLSVCLCVCLCALFLSARYLKNRFMDHHQIWWVGAGGEPLEQVQFWC